MWRTFASQGPEATDPDLSLEVFRQRLRRHRGEIKGLRLSLQQVADKYEMPPNSSDNWPRSARSDLLARLQE